MKKPDSCPAEGLRKNHLADFLTTTVRAEACLPSVRKVSKLVSGHHCPSIPSTNGVVRQSAKLFLREL